LAPYPSMVLEDTPRRRTRRLTGPHEIALSGKFSSTKTASAATPLTAAPQTRAGEPLDSGMDVGRDPFGSSPRRSFLEHSCVRMVTGHQGRPEGQPYSRYSVPGPVPM
jgi:hypothetical protein